METYTKIKYTPLKYRNDTKSISVPKDAIINNIGINKIKHIGPKRELSFNSNTMIYSNTNNYNANNIKNKYLNYQYNNTEQQNNNYNLNLNNKNLYNNNNLNQNCVTINPLNKTTPHYYSTKLKDKILNNLRDNFQEDKIKKKCKIIMKIKILKKMILILIEI